MKSYLTKIYLFRFFDDLILIYPLYTVMFAERGISPVQISILLAVWALTSLILEVPSGAWADMYSRKNILAIGQVIRMIGYIIWAVFPNFYGFLIGFILWGVKSALTSGTFQSLIYDELKHVSQEREYIKVIGKTKTLAFFAILLASLLSSLAIPFGYQVVLAISVVSTIISAVFIYKIPDVSKVESTNETQYFQIIKEGLSLVLKDRRILSMTIFLSLAYALGGALDEYWTLFANGTGLPNYGLGIFLALMSLSQVIGSYFAHKFENIKSIYYYLLFGIGGVLLLTSAFINSISALSGLIAFSMLFTIIQTVYDGKFQDSIPTKTRATVSSVNGFFVDVLVICVYFSVGTFAEISSYRTMLMLFGVIIVFIGVLYSGKELYRNKKVN